MEIIIIVLVITILAIVGVAIIQKIKTACFNRKWNRQSEELEEKVENARERRKHISYSL